MTPSLTLVSLQKSKLNSKENFTKLHVIQKTFSNGQSFASNNTLCI